MDSEKDAEFLWSVQRFDTLPIVPGTSLLSPKFYAHSSKAAEFCLRIEAGQFPSTVDESVGRVFICRCDNDGPENVEIKYALTYPFGGAGSEHIQIFSKPQHGTLYQSYETDALEITKDNMSDEELLVFCRILSYADDEYESFQQHDDGDLYDLSQAFKDLFETSSFSDAVIRIQNREFNVHRAILDARCPGLLEECQANQSRETFMQCEEHTIEAVLYYIYTGIFECENIADDLCFLLKKCSDFLFKHLCLPFFKVMYAHTFFKWNQISFDWNIENFFNFSEDMKFCRRIIDNDPSNWFKITFFITEHKSSARRLKFVMHKMREDTVTFVQGAIGVVDAAGEYTLIFKGSHLFNNECPLEVTLDDKIGLIRSKMNRECVMFNIEIIFTDGVPFNSMRTLKESSEINISQNIIKLSELGHDIGKLCENSNHSDAILKIKDRRISAHRAILSARSLVFRKMFQQNTFQGEHAEVAINELDEKVALSMIHYIYSANVVNFNTDLAFELYNAANLYEIPQLRRKCFTHMKFSLNETNVGQILLFADAQNEHELKSFVYDFINTSPNSVLESKEFKGIMKSYEYLHLEAMKEISSYTVENV